MSFARYPKYKSSDVEWLGTVPAHWEVKPLRRFSCMVQTGPFGSQLHADEYVSGGTPVVNPVNMIDGKIVPSEDVSVPGFVVERLWHQRLRVGDVVFSRRGELGRCALVSQTEEGWLCGTGSMILRLSGTEYDAGFLSYFLSLGLVRQYFESFSIGAIMDSLSSETLLAMPMIVAPVREQALIVEFVARETAKIDALVAEQQRLIELLKEKRLAVISHAVTKGLNPNAPMKPSGIEWLGEVPAHWIVGPLKRFFTNFDGRRVPLSGEERSTRGGEFPYYGASGVIDYVDDFIFDEPLVLVSEDGANLINRSSPIAFVATGKYWVNNHAHILRPLDCNFVFWAERIESIDLIPFATGSAQPKLTSEALGNLMIAVPPTEGERSAIEKYIAAATTSIEFLRLEAQRAIDLLQERRTALISAAVTGQIDVRGLVEESAA